MLMEEMPAIVSVGILALIFIISFLQDMSRARRSRAYGSFESKSYPATAKNSIERGLSRSLEGD